MKFPKQICFYCFVVILSLLHFPAFGKAEEETPAWEALTRNYLAAEISRFGKNYRETQKGPIVDFEDRAVVALAFELELPESRIVPALKRIAEFNASATFFSTQGMTIVSGKNNGTSSGSNPEIWLSGQITFSPSGNSLENTNAHNLPLQKALNLLFKHSTFNPYSPRSEISSTWLTWLMVDSSLRMQIIGLATSEQAVLKLKKELDDSGVFSSSQLSDFVLHQKDNVPEWRIDREKNYTEKPYHESAGLASVWRFHLILNVVP